MRDAITKALAVGEATAKTVAKRSGIELADVLKTLGHMQRDAEVEREKRNGNEYVYWLAGPAERRSLAGRPPIKYTIDTPRVVEQIVSATDIERMREELERLHRENAELRAEATQIARIGGDAVAERDQARRSEAEKHERMLQACAESERLRNDLAAAMIDRDALREQLDAIPSVEQHTAGYLIRAPKRKPAIVTKPESAVARAMAAARNGSGRADVYALVLTGTARRGAEWRPA